MKRFISLFLARFNQFAVPLIVYPLCVSNVGLNNFGFIAFCTGMSALLAKFISFNMDTFSARMIKDSGEDRALADLAIITPIFMKLLLSICTLPFYIAYCCYQYSGYELIAALLCLYPVISTCFSFNHYVLGFGEFHLLFKASLLEKGVLLILVVSLIHSADDFWLIPFSYLISVCTPIIYYIVKIKPYKANLKLRTLFANSKKYFSVGKWLLVGKCLQLHMNGAKVILGFVFDYKWVAVYDVCEKIVNVSKVPLTMVGEFLFSRKDSGRSFYLRFFYVEILMALLLILLLALFGEYLLLYFAKEHFESDMHQTLNALSFILLAIPLLIVFGSNYIVKEMSADIYGKLLFVSNLISLQFLLMWYYFASNDFYLFVYWVVFCEYLLACFCVCFVLYKKRRVYCEK